MSKSDHIQDSKIIRFTLLSLFLSIFIFLLKLFASFITKSVAIYSDAMESIVNIASAIIAFLGSRITLKPPDKTHPYGYYKFEYFISMCEAIFILGASVSILYKVYRSFLNPEGFKNLNLGILIISFTAILNSLLSYYLFKQGKKENSPILISHASHIFTDVLTTLGVMGGVYLTNLLKIWIIDPLIALLISINIMFLGYKLIKNSISSLLDASLSSEKVNFIQNIIEKTIETFSQQGYKIYDYHDLKTRRAGRKGFVEFHLTVSNNISVKEAHDLCNEIEKRIINQFPELSVIIHIEPEEEKKS